MSEEPNIPTLNYFEDQGSALLRAMLRLVLLAGAIGAFCSGAASVVDLIRGWPQFLHPSSYGSSLEFFAFLSIASVLLTGIAVAVSLSLLLTTGGGRPFAFWSQVLELAARTSLSGMYILNFATMRQGGLPRNFLVGYIVQNSIGIISGSLLPLLVLVILWRKDTRQVLQRGSATGVG